MRLARVCLHTLTSPRPRSPPTVVNPSHFTCAYTRHRDTHRPHSVIMLGRACRPPPRIDRPTRHTLPMAASRPSSRCPPSLALSCPPAPAVCPCHIHCTYTNQRDAHGSLSLPPAPAALSSCLHAISTVHAPTDSMRVTHSGIVAPLAPAVHPFRYIQRARTH